MKFDPPLLPLKLRHVWRWLHRWMGLLAGLAFVLLGLTGSLLAFRDEIDALLAPEFHGTRAQGARKSFEELVALARARNPGMSQAMLAFDPPHGPFRLLYRHPVQEMPRSDGPRYELALNPYTGVVQGKRLRGGGISFTRTEIMGTLLHFHANLWAGKTGRTIVGVIALLLLFSSLSGISLWRPSKGEWRRALSINRVAGRIRFHFDLHRIAGIGAAALLAVIAFTGSFFAFNTFYRSLIDPFSKTTLFDPPPKVESRQPHAPLTVAKILAIAQQRYPGAAAQSLGLPESPNHVYTLALQKIRLFGELMRLSKPPGNATARRERLG